MSTEAPLRAAGTAEVGSVVAVLDVERPARPGRAAMVRTFFWRAMLKIKHVPEQLFDVTFFPVIFLLMFTFLFGGALAGSTEAYLQNLLPGILAMTVAMITMYTGMTINRDIEKGVHDRFRSLPIWRPAPLVGALCADAVRYCIAGTIVLVLGLVLGFRPGAGVLGVVAAVALLVLFAFSISWIWTYLGLRMRSEQALMGVSMMVLFPLTFLSNVFVAPVTMPGWLQAFVGVNPITILVDAMRGLIHDGIVGSSVAVTLVISGAILAAFSPLAVRTYRRQV